MLKPIVHTLAKYYVVVAALVVVCGSAVLDRAVTNRRSLSETLQITQQDEDENGVYEAYYLSFRTDESVRSHVPLRSELLCEVRDTNQDGRLDVWTYYKDGDMLSRASDKNNDGKVDLWEQRINGDRVLVAKDTDFDGKGDSEKEERYVRVH